MNITTGVNYTYCNLQEFHNAYKDVYGYICILVCVFGSLTNIINICVLTSKEMRWPTNFILTGLAVADLFVMIDYIPFVIYINFTSKDVNYYLYGKALFLMFHALFTQICHFISCTLTVLLAVWRYIAVTLPQNAKVWCSNYRTIIAIVLSYIICPLVSLPLFFSLYIDSKYQMYFENGTAVSDLIINNTEQIINNNHTVINQTIYFLNYSISYNFWVYSLIIKLVPCILLIILSQCLISALIQTKERRRKLLNKKPLVRQGVNNQKKNNKKKDIDASEQQADRTTKMLLAVLLLFLITELPQAILGILSAIIGETFERECYRTLGK